jgi:hypothetical protein
VQRELRLAAPCLVVLCAALVTTYSTASGQVSAVQRSQGPPQTRKQGKIERPESPHLQFVTEYLRELAAMEEIRAKGEKELSTDDVHAKFRTMIYTNTLVDLELHSQIRMLNGMSLHDPYDTLIETITSIYEEKIEIWKRMSEIAALFLEDDPKPGVDYSKVLVEMPQLRARLDYLDQTLFQTSPLVFSTLIDTTKTNSKGNVDRLIITKAERERLIDDIKTEFGPGVDAKDANYLVSAGSVVKSYLEKESFKSSDDPLN